MCPELPGRPSRGFAMKHGVIPYLLPIDLTTYLLQGKHYEVIHNRKVAMDY